MNVIEADQSKYEGGISVVPVYLAKGLEFDAVLLIDVDEEHYKTQNTMRSYCMSDVRDHFMIYGFSIVGKHLR